MKRLNKIRYKMKENNIEGLVVNSPQNIRYLSGFKGTEAVLFITNTKAFLITDFRYIEQARKESPNFEIVLLKTDVYSALEKLAPDLRILGFEEEFVTYKVFIDLKAVFSKAEFIEMSSSFKDLRSVKDNEEIEAIRRAVEIADKSFQDILRRIAPGQSEEEIGLELEYAMRKNGASGPSFDFIVASGLRSSMPHGTATSKIIKKGEALTLDFGAVYSGYCSDITRSVFFGKPDDKMSTIYNIVLEAQLAGIDAVKPGKAGKEIDAVARKIITDAGYGEYFGHGLGHSVGLEIHESPNLSPRETKILEPGMVVTVEPGIYIPDIGGVRIEDTVLVTKNGVEVLTQTTKQFIIID